MGHKEIRRRLIDFFVQRGHKEVPSSSLLPTDPSVLFTTAGMQQFKPYYTGEKSPYGNKVVSIQKCIRTSDIDEVGDESHLTFFEMLGNFSFQNEYWKKEAIEYAYQFINREMGLEIDYVSVFEGDENIQADNESEEIWRSLDPKLTIKKFSRKDNFWGPTGDEGPCGPTTEIYVNDTEVWNIVFNQYYQEKNGNLRDLENRGIDTGMGLERLAMSVQKTKNIFETDLFAPVMSQLAVGMPERTRRIIADHCRSICFLVADDIVPSNKDQGYVLRRLIRRVVTQEYLSEINFGFQNLFLALVDEYKTYYQELDLNKTVTVFENEKSKFKNTLGNGLKELKKMETISPESAFKLYESYGLPYEVIKEVAGEKAKSFTREDFEQEFKKHQQASRAGAEKKFGGHGLLLDTGELKAADEEELKKVTRLHTVTHLLQAALRQVLGNEVAQAGSDITAERLRFDFTFPRKLDSSEIEKVQEAVNDVIQKDLVVEKKTMPYEEAVKTGALHFFKIKYPSEVDVYSVGDFSKEFCGGPHVKHTGEIGKFKIIKEEAVSAGIRRIRAIIE